MAVTCNGSVSQKWILGPRPRGLAWAANPSYCLYATDFVKSSDGPMRSQLAIAACNFSDVHQRWTVTAEIRGMGNMCLISPPGAQDWTPAQVGACSYLGIEYYHSWTMGL